MKKKVPDIAASVKKQWPDLKLRVAFAPYRDYEDFDRDDQETCDFTNDFSGSQSAFVKALSGISAGRSLALFMVPFRLSISISVKACPCCLPKF